MLSGSDIGKVLPPYRHFVWLQYIVVPYDLLIRLELYKKIVDIWYKTHDEVGIKIKVWRCPALIRMPTFGPMLWYRFG